MRPEMPVLRVCALGASALLRCCDALRCCVTPSQRPAGSGERPRGCASARLGQGTTDRGSSVHPTPCFRVELCPCSAARSTTATPDRHFQLVGLGSTPCRNTEDGDRYRLTDILGATALPFSLEPKGVPPSPLTNRLEAQFAIAFSLAVLRR